MQHQLKYGGRRQWRPSGIRVTYQQEREMLVSLSDTQHNMYRYTM